jgi:hypothetical protein
VVEEVPDWIRTASSADVDRIGRLASVWKQALDEARSAGFRRSVAAEGLLLDPGAGLLRPTPAPGSYSCRMLQLGSATPRTRPFSAAQSGFCYVGVDAQNRLWLSKQTGAFRRQGYLWEDVDPRRLIFLGGIASGGGDRPPPYGSRPEADTASVLERIGPLRFRLVTARSSGNYRLEVLELTPAPTQPDE